MRISTYDDAAALGQAEYSGSVGWHRDAREVDQDLKISERKSSVPLRAIVEAPTENHGTRTGSVNNTSFQQSRNFAFVGRYFTEQLGG
jgi:hypothetical protein